MDEVKTVIKAFKEQDPDGNGKADTVGLLGDKSVVADGGFFTFDPIFNANHAYPKNWFKDEEETSSTAPRLQRPSRRSLS